jgi:hypothetical protein
MHIVILGCKRGKQRYSQVPHHKSAVEVLIARTAAKSTVRALIWRHNEPAASSNTAVCSNYPFTTAHQTPINNRQRGVQCRQRMVLPAQLPNPTPQHTATPAPPCTPQRHVRSDAAARYAAQQECNFSRADSEFVMMRSLWLQGEPSAHFTRHRLTAQQGGSIALMRCQFFPFILSLLPFLRKRYFTAHMHSDVHCLRGSFLVYRAHKLFVQVLKISLAWGDRFAADAQLKCPLHTPLPLPSYDHNTSECFVYIPEILFQVLSAAGHRHFSSRNIFLGPFQGASCRQIL